MPLYHISKAGTVSMSRSSRKESGLCVHRLVGSTKESYSSIFFCLAPEAKWLLINFLIKQPIPNVRCRVTKVTTLLGYIPFFQVVAFIIKSVVTCVVFNIF